MNNASDFLASLNASLDVRVEAERAKNAENDSIQATLSSIRKNVSHERIAEIMLNANYDVSLICKRERVNAMRNVYTLEKDVNIARALASAATLNHYTRAILQTALSLAEHDLLLTHDDAQAACSLDVTLKNKSRDKLVRRYMKHVAKSTAATQSSSSINALQAFNVLVETRDDANVVCYRLNRDASVTEQLCALVQ